MSRTVFAVSADQTMIALGVVKPETDNAGYRLDYGTPADGSICGDVAGLHRRCAIDLLSRLGLAIAATSAALVLNIVIGWAPSHHDVCWPLVDPECGGNQTFDSP